MFKRMYVLGFPGVKKHSVSLISWVKQVISVAVALTQIRPRTFNSWWLFKHLLCPTVAVPMYTPQLMSTSGPPNPGLGPSNHTSPWLGQQTGSSASEVSQDQKSFWTMLIMTTDRSNPAIKWATWQRPLWRGLLKAVRLWMKTSP